MFDYIIDRLGFDFSLWSDRLLVGFAIILGVLWGWWGAKGRYGRTNDN